MEEIYETTRFSIQKDTWRMLHPKHFVNLLLIQHIEHSREKEILDTVAIMRHGLSLNKNNLLVNDCTENVENVNEFGLLKFFTTHCNSKGSLKSIETNVISDIFKPFKKNDGSTTVPKFILIEGAPGIGKTTLCKEIAYKWAKLCLLEDTRLLFLIYLRDPNISNIKNLKDFVHYFYNFDEGATELSKECAKLLNEIDSNDIMIVFDGYDEFNSSNDSLITDILDRKVLPRCRIVVTSRLTASDMLHRMADVRVEVLGFTNESKIEYIEQELKGNSDKINELKTYLDGHPSVKSICYMPMIMTILVYVFKEKGHLPNNSIKLYDKFVSLALSHHLQKKNKLRGVFVSLESFPTKFRTIISDLSKFAFLTLKSKQKVFSKEDIKKICPTSTLASSDLESLGLVNLVQYFCTDKGNSDVFNFLHMSIQEYLAAYHISSIDQYSQFKELEKTFLNVMYQGTWNMFIAMNESTLMFDKYSIYCRDIHPENLSNWISGINFSSYLKCFLDLYGIINANAISNGVIQILFFENDQSSNSTANTYQEQLYISLCSRKNIHLTKLELYVIGKDLIASNSNWIIFLQNLSLTNKFSIVMHTNHVLLLDRANHQQIIDCFKFEASPRQLVMLYCHISQRTIDAINFSNLQCLSQFQIINCTYEHNALTMLANSLSKISTLSCIVVRNNTFSTKQVDAVCTILSGSYYLQILDLSNNNLHNDIIKVAKALEHTRTLKVLNLMRLQLNDDQIPESAGEAIASVILNNTGLECLVLNNNNINKGLLHIIRALQQLNSLQMLDLGNTNMSKEVCDELALAIECNQCLNTVHLNGNNLQSSAIVVLRALSKLSSLKVLNLQTNYLNENTGELLASVIFNNTQLTHLFLNNNSIGKGLYFGGSGYKVQH